MTHHDAYRLYKNSALTSEPAVGDVKHEAGSLSRRLPVALWRLLFRCFDFLPSILFTLDFLCERGAGRSHLAKTGLSASFYVNVFSLTLRRTFLRVSRLALLLGICPFCCCGCLLVFFLLLRHLFSLCRLKHFTLSRQGLVARVNICLTCRLYLISHL